MHLLCATSSKENEKLDCKLIGDLVSAGVLPRTTLVWIRGRWRTVESVPEVCEFFCGPAEASVRLWHVFEARLQRFLSLLSALL